MKEKEEMLTKIPTKEESKPKPKEPKKLEEFKKSPKEVEEIEKARSENKLVEKDLEEDKQIEDKKQVSKPAVLKDSKEKKEEKIELDRIYIIPIRKYSLKAPKYKRAKKAISIIKKFLARHMKVEDRDFKKIKIDKYLNEEIWFRGIKKPANKIKVKAIKKGGIVYAELAEVPEVVKFKMEREKRLKEKIAKVKPIKHKHEHDHEHEKTSEEKTEEVEKEKASVEAGLVKQKQESKELKHTAEGKHQEKTTPRRMALKK